MKKRLICSLLLLAVLTSACASPLLGGATATPQPTPLPTSTPEPTPTPTPAPAARVIEADRAMLLNDLEEANAGFQAAFDSAPDDSTRAAALLGMGRVFYEQGNCPDAQPIFQQVLQQHPADPAAAPANYYLARCYENAADYISAANSYSEYLRLNPGVLDAYIQELRGDDLFYAGSYDQAVAAYQAALQATPAGDFDSISLKIGRTYTAAGNTSSAIDTYIYLYGATASDYTKAAVNLLLGQVYLTIGQTTDAYARFQDSVANFPRSYDTYSGLVQLVNDGEAVDEYNRGLVDYYAGQYALAIDAFKRYLQNNPEHDGSAHYYIALGYTNLDQVDAALAEWDSLIADHAGESYWTSAWDEKAYLLWTRLDKYTDAAQALLDCIAANPAADEAPDFLFEAGRIYERGGYLEEAATTWQRGMDEYPNSDMSYKGLFFAGITYYRLAKYQEANAIFQRLAALATTTQDQAAAWMWSGKSLLMQGNADGAKSAWESAVQADPTGYYSIRAAELLENESPLSAPVNYDFGIDTAGEQAQAEQWLREKFSLTADVDLSQPGDLVTYGEYQRAQAYTDLGQYDLANTEFETLRQSLASDPARSYRLLQVLLDLGYYRTAIFTARQILDFAGFNDQTSLNAPAYFTHIRFGPYFRESVMQAALEEGVQPLLIFALIRQESMFESFVVSSADARGLMQLMPATGQDMANLRSWPTNYTEADLMNADVNIQLGILYFSIQMNYLDGNLYGALAAYNGGPGNAYQWLQLSGDDPDLFLECVRYEETRNYIRHIVENYYIYKSIYQRPD